MTALRGDTQIVNCIAPHPHESLLASCGIDSTVKLWAPTRSVPRQPLKSRGLLQAVAENEAGKAEENWSSLAHVFHP